MPNIVPGALWRPVDVGNRAARRKGRGLIGHVAVSNSTLLIPGPLATRSSDWTFYLPKNPYPTGERFAQLIDLDLQCWSSAAGNATCPAFESEGGVGTAAQVNAEPWTPNQVESAAMILAHLHKTEGTPLQDMVNSLPTSRGFGVHRYGIDPWRVSGGEVWSSARGKLCPGDAKTGQIPQIIARARQIAAGQQQEDDMNIAELYGWRDDHGRNAVDFQNFATSVLDQVVGRLSTLEAKVGTAGGVDLTVLKPLLLEAVRDGLAADNDAQADEIVDRLAARLATPSA